MKEEELRTAVLQTLKLTDAPKKEQDVALAEVESIANDRFALALPEMLSDEQINQIEKMRAESKDDKAIMQWVEGQLPDYEGMMQDIIQDVADEIAAI
jgi:hypothetical protein